MARSPRCCCRPLRRVWAVLSENYEILLRHALPTTLETIVSFTIAGALGVGLAVAITFSDRIREALYPNIVLFQLVPKVALAPLFIVWLGVGSQSCVTFGVFISFFPIVVSTASGLVGASPDTLRMCRSLAASKWQVFYLIRFPYAMPFIFAGMKVGVTMAMIGVIVGEFITAQIGLGYIIMFASSAGETATVLAAIVLLCVAGLVLYTASSHSPSWSCGDGMAARLPSAVSYDYRGAVTDAGIGGSSLAQDDPRVPAASTSFPERGRRDACRDR